MRIGTKDLSVMYANLTVDERKAPFALKKADSILGDPTDDSRTVMEVKITQSERNRS